MQTGFRAFLYSVTIVSFTSGPNLKAGNPIDVPARALPVIEQIMICSAPISDRQGNAVGVTIPLKRAGRLLLFEAVIDNQTGNFILDTGSSGLVLNSTYFRGAMTIDDEEGGGVTGGTAAAVSRTRVKRLVIGDMAYEGISADVTPLGHLETRRGVKILGLFGMSMLKNLEIVLDLRRSELQLYRLDKQGARIGTPAPPVKYDIVQKIELCRNIMLVKATIGGKQLDFCLDTGAESNVLNIKVDKKVLGTVTINRRTGLAGVGQGRGEVLYGTLNDFSIGNKTMIPMETIVCSLAAMSQKYGYPIDGMLGYDFFAKGIVYINLVKKEMGICLGKEGGK